MPPKKIAAKKTSAARKKSSASADIVLNFDFEKETKNAVRFQEVTEEDRGVVGTLYVLKSALPDDIPQSLTVTISAG